MPWIQNVSMSDIRNGFHFVPGENAMLIQIVDPPGDFPTPKYGFKEIHRFQFLDVEDKDFVLDEAMRCSQEQANELVELLLHCHAGVCRSGAVAEVGVIMGFQDTEAFRSPNLLVKHRMMKALGLTYDENEPHTINGVPFDHNDWRNPVPPNREENWD